MPGGLLIALFVIVELLLLHSYRDTTRTTRDFQRSTDTTRAIAGVQRETLLLSRALDRLRTGAPLAPIALQRARVELDLGILARASSNASLAAHLRVMRAQLGRFDSAFAAAYGAGPLAADMPGRANAERLLDQLDTQVKLTADATDRELYETLHATLAGRGQRQLLIAGVGALALLLGAALAIVLRRAVRIDFARSYSLLERSEARFRRLIEQLPAVVYQLTLGDDGRPPEPVYVSPRASVIIGMDADADNPITLRRLAGHVHPDDRGALAAAIMDAQAGNALGPVEFRFRRTGGEEIWLRDSGAVVTDGPDGRQLQGLMFDVTVAKRVEAERGRLEAELRLGQKLEAVGQLAAGIAHEINTPIQFVGDTVCVLEQAFGDLLTLQEVQDELARAAAAGAIPPGLLERLAQARVDADLEYLRERVPGAFDRAADGIDRVATIVGAMREFAHPATAEQVPVDLNRTLRNTLIVAANEYKYVADLQTDLEELPPVVCNAGDVSQAFLNLIVNAAHAIADRVGDSGERGEIRVQTRLDDDGVVVSIGDTGCGIPAEIAGRVFDPFFTTKVVGRGTGQGLAIARVLVVEHHAGTIEFDTEPGRGTTFRVRLPIAGRAALTLLEPVTA
jgi:signal transduction histidine kinase